MNRRSIGMTGCIYMCVLALSACSRAPRNEITSKEPYADHIGTKYSVVVDDLYALGVYESFERKGPIGYVTLIPHGNVGGSAFAFRRRVPKGQIVKIVSAWQPYILLKDSVYYLVVLENSDLPPGIPVRLQLDLENEGVGADLNPAIYRKLAKNN